ncbi:hypothetical protein [Lewinella sp. LCG006]|uniref:hypothetical protein n=1 Tax=Lewinella sp. LCG006 TaxID=3231911 RepID=UPI00345F171D
MKKFQICLLFFVFLSCCDDDDAVPQPPPPPACLEVLCETEEEFFGKAIRNSECWIADYVRFRGPGSSIYLYQERPDGFTEVLSFPLNRNTDLSDTIWLGFTNSGNPSPHIVSASYRYDTDHGVLGGFRFEYGSAPSYQDFLIIDYFNADTSILEGHFQINFPPANPIPFVNPPDSMRLGCGSFRVKEE